MPPVGRGGRASAGRSEKGFGGREELRARGAAFCVLTHGTGCHLLRERAAQGRVTVTVSGGGPGPDGMWAY